MATMSFDWALSGNGWVECVVADADAHASIEASSITDAPGDLLRAVARLALGAPDQRVDFDMEPTEIRWVFNRDRTDVNIRLLQIRDYTRREDAAAVLWQSVQPLETLARIIVRAFDRVADEHGEDGYSEQWGWPFPRQELEALRRAWRSEQTTPETRS